MTYAEKLLDPRWQRKRTEVLNRDDFACQLCRDKTETLHVHHFSYAKSGNPWDSKIEELITYCATCHICVEYIKRDAEILNPLIASKAKLSNSETRLTVIVYNLDTGYNEIIMIKIFDGKITDGLYVTKKTVDFITTNLTYENIIENGEPISG